MIDSAALAAHFRFIKHIVMHQRGHVNHFTGGSNDHVSLTHVAERLPGQEHHGWAQHLAAVPLHVPTQRVHRRKVARQLSLKGLAHFCQERRK